MGGQDSLEYEDVYYLVGLSQSCKPWNARLPTTVHDFPRLSFVQVSEVWMCIVKAVRGPCTPTYHAHHHAGAKQLP